MIWNTEDNLDDARRILQNELKFIMAYLNYSSVI